MPRKLAQLNSGVACPTCGSMISDVKETRRIEGKIVRSRECFNHHAYKTVETVIQEVAVRQGTEGRPTLSRLAADVEALKAVVQSLKDELTFRLARSKRKELSK